MTHGSIPDSSVSSRFDDKYLSGVLGKVFKSPVSGLACSALAGDASDRKYFRVRYDSTQTGHKSDSVIIMQLREPLAGREPDFTRMLNFLQSLDSPVPELFYYDPDRGLLFLEDCGTDTLEDRLRRHPEETRQYYLQAVSLLVDLQQRANRAINADCPAYHLRFDVEKLMWELDFMLEHYVEGLSKKKLAEDSRKQLRESFLSMSQTLSAEPPCFSHRDFHSRNLMASNGKLIMLDFQDARMGPCQYDLVSLLKDSYTVLDDGLRDELAASFVRLKEEAQGKPIDREDFFRIFDLMSIQRNLKAVGTFAFQRVGKNNDRYLQYIPPTLEYVRKTLNKRSELAPLRDILIECIPGLGTDTGKNEV